MDEVRSLRSAGAAAPGSWHVVDRWSAIDEAGLTEALDGVRRGDEASFRVIYRAVQPRLLRYVRTLVGDDAEDVASEAWLQIARDIGSFKGDFPDFRGWAATVGRNRAMDHLRRVRRRPGSDFGVDVLTEMTTGEDTAALALEGISTDAAIEIIMRLPRDQAEAVLLRVLMGLDAKSAGRVLGKRAGAVRTAAYRGLRRLSEWVDEGHGDTNDASDAGGMR